MKDKLRFACKPRAMARRLSFPSPTPALEFLQRNSRACSNAFAASRAREGDRSRAAALGLPLSRSSSSYSAATSRVESQPGVGSTFTVTVPFGTAHLPDHEGQSISKAAETEPAVTSTNVRPQAYINEAVGWSRRGSTDWSDASPEAADNVERARITSDGQRHRVVLADDNADMRDYAGRLLRDAGFDVDVAPDGETCA